MHDESFGCIRPKRLVGSPEESLDVNHRTVSVSFIFMLSRKDEFGDSVLFRGRAELIHTCAPQTRNELPLISWTSRIRRDAIEAEEVEHRPAWKMLQEITLVMALVLIGLVRATQAMQGLLFASRTRQLDVARDRA